MTTYYVDGNSQNASNSNEGTTEAKPWKTIQFAVTNANVRPGDTIKIKPGTYNGEISMKHNTGVNGSEEGGYVTIEGFDENNPPVLKSTKTTESPPMWLVQDCNYVELRNIEFYGFYGAGVFVRSVDSSAHHIKLDGLRFVDSLPSPGHMIRADTNASTLTLKHLHVVNCLFDNCWPAREPDSSGNMIGNEICTFIGNVQYSSMRNNTMTNCKNIGFNTIGTHHKSSDQHKGQPSYIIISGNTVTGTYNSKGNGNDIYHDRSLGPILVENNVCTNGSGVRGWTTNGEEGGWDGDKLDKDNWGQTIVRNNVFMTNHIVSQIGMGETREHPSKREAFVHNVCIGKSTSSYRHSPFDIRYSSNASAKNNVLLHRNPNNSTIFRSTDDVPASQYNNWELDGNLWHSVRGQSVTWEWPTGDCTSWNEYKNSQEPNGLWGDPTFVNEGQGDFKLQSSSVGYGQAISLTKTVGSGQISKTLKVKDAKYFCDGFGIQHGDDIEVGGQEARVASVNYDTNTLTLADAISWQDGTDIYYAHQGSRSVGLQDQVSEGPIDGGDIIPPEVVDIPHRKIRIGTRVGYFWP